MMEPREIVRSALDAFNAHDLDRLLSHFDANYTLDTFGKTPQHIPNREIARAVFTTDFEEARDRHTEVIRLLQDGKSVTVQCRDQLTHPLLGPLDIPTFMIFEVENGLITHCDYYQDSAFWAPAS